MLTWEHLRPGMLVKGRRHRLVEHYKTYTTLENMMSYASDASIVLQAEPCESCSDGMHQSKPGVRITLLGSKGIFSLASPAVWAYDWEEING